MHSAFSRYMRAQQIHTWDHYNLNEKLLLLLKWKGPKPRPSKTEALSNG